MESDFYEQFGRSFNSLKNIRCFLIRSGLSFKITFASCYKLLCVTRILIASRGCTFRCRSIERQRKLVSLARYRCASVIAWLARSPSTNLFVIRVDRSPIPRKYVSYDACISKRCSCHRNFTEKLLRASNASKESKRTYRTNNYYFSRFETWSLSIRETFR